MKRIVRYCQCHEASAAEILRELERISQAGLLSPQERALFQQIVRRAVDGDTGRLYQKALADELGISRAPSRSV